MIYINVEHINFWGGQLFGRGLKVCRELGMPVDRILLHQAFDQEALDQQQAFHLEVRFRI